MNTEKIGTKTNPMIDTKNLVITGMFTAIICVLAQIQFPTQPIPFTLSLLAIFLAGALLKPKYALLSVLAYVLLGAFGVPVFAGFTGGIAILFGKTGGYIMAYPLMALVTSLFYHMFKKGKTIWLALGMITALILCYSLGTLWFSFVTKIDYYTSLTYCVFPFILFDSLKIALAVALSTVLRPALKKINADL